MRLIKYSYYSPFGSITAEYSYNRKPLTVFCWNKKMHIISLILLTLTRWNSGERKQESLFLIMIIKIIWVKCHHNEVSSYKNHFLGPLATIHTKVLVVLISNLQIIRPAVERKTHLPYFQVPQNATYFSLKSTLKKPRPATFPERIYFIFGC